MGTELKLVAIAESGLLSVIITPFEPPNLHRKAGDQWALGKEYPWNKDNEVRGDQDKGWPLLYKASVQDSGLVAAKVWWATQRPLGSDYLVTWEVAAGGLKGHLYTDLPEVDLKLWPKTIYKVQVEVVSGPLSEPHVSQLLILDTNNITAVVQSQQQQPHQEEVIQPNVDSLEEAIQFENIIIGVLVPIITLAVAIAIIFRRKSGSRTAFNDASSANSKLSLNRSIPDLALDESLVRNKGNSLLFSPAQGPTDRHSYVYSVPYPPTGPQNTLGIPNTPNHYINIHSLALGSDLKSESSVI